MKSGSSLIVSLSDTVEDLGCELADWLYRRIAEAVSLNGEAWVALSGGTTPAVLYDALIRNAEEYDIPWEKVHIFFTDERFVPFEDSLSNGGNAWRQFFSTLCPGPHIRWIVGPDSFDVFDDASAAVKKTLIQCNDGLADVPKSLDLPEFDVVLLGVGADGHVASIIPTARVLCEQGHYVAVEGGSPEAVRVSMNLEVISNGAHIAFAVKGEGKRDVSTAVLERHYSHLPAVQVIEKAAGFVCWFGDRRSFNGVLERKGPVER